MVMVLSTNCDKFQRDFKNPKYPKRDMREREAEDNSNRMNNMCRTGTEIRFKSLWNPYDGDSNYLSSKSSVI